jgi:hypothetical protein
MKIQESSANKSPNCGKDLQRGSILIYLVVVIVVASALGAGIVSMTTTSSFTGLSYNPSDQARYLAMSGLGYARSLIQANPDKADDFEDWVVYTLEDGQFRLKYDDETGLITSIGRVFIGTPREANFKITGLISSKAGGLLAEYLFEIDHDLGRDTSGYNYHGTPDSGVERKPKPCSPNIPAYTEPLDADQSTCYFASFDGDGSGIPIRPEGEEAELEFEDEITVMAWVRWGVEPKSADAFATIITSSRHGSLGQFWLQHGGSDNEFYEFAVQTETERLFVRSASQSSKEWRHVTGVYDGSSIMIYIDGIKQSQVKSLSGNILSQRDTDKFVFKIGSDRTSGRKFIGDLDEVRLFDKALSEAEISGYLTTTRPCSWPLLMAEYRFDECTWDGSAGEVLDSSGNNLHGTIFGTPAPDTGKINNAGSFINGEKMGISLPGSPTLKPQEEITISAWIKRNDISNLGLQNIYHFGNWQQFLRLDQTSDIVFSLTGKGTLRASGVVNNLNWNHVAATYDDNKMIIYVNGQEQASQNASGNIEYTGNQFIIGNISTGSSESFNGKIDELKIFDKALTSQQISALYDNENSGKNCDGTTREAIICPDPEPDDFRKFIIDENVFVYGSALEFKGSNVIGHGATIVIKEGLSTSDINQGAHINVSNIYFGGDVSLDGGSASLGSNVDPGKIYINGDAEFRSGQRHIYGDVYVNGDLHLSGANIHGNIYVNGDVNLYWGAPNLSTNSNIYYTGQLNAPNNYNQSVLNKCIPQVSVPGFEMPDYDIPGPRPDQWYADRGYVSSGILVSGLKIFSDNYTSTSWRPTAYNAIIVSKGDITITGLGGSGLTGVLYAPYGKVTFGGSFFEGTVIARDGFFVESGGTNVTFRNIEDFFPSHDDIPIGP